MVGLPAGAAPPSSEVSCCCCCLCKSLSQACTILFSFFFFGLLGERARESRRANVWGKNESVCRECPFFFTAHAPLSTLPHTQDSSAVSSGVDTVSCGARWANTVVGHFSVPSFFFTAAFFVITIDAALKVRARKAVRATVADDVGNGDHLEAVVARKLAQVVSSCHRAVIQGNLTEDTDRVDSSKLAEIYQTTIAESTRERGKKKKLLPTVASVWPMRTRVPPTA